MLDLLVPSSHRNQDVAACENAWAAKGLHNDFEDQQEPTIKETNDTINVQSMMPCKITCTTQGTTFQPKIINRLHVIIFAGGVQGETFDW